MENRCVFCGAALPEGRQVCPDCEAAARVRTYPKPTLNYPKERSHTMHQDWIRKLTSRKFWMAVTEFVIALLIFLKKDQTYAEQIGALIMLGVTPIAYMFAEGWADAGSAGNLTLEVKQPAEPEKPPENV